MQTSSTKGESMRKEIIRSLYTQEHIDTVEALIALTSGNAEVKADILAKFTAALDSEGDADYYEDLTILWVLAEFAGYKVDWRDTESLQYFVEKLAAQWGAGDFKFNPDLRDDEGDPLNTTQSIDWACQQLSGRGLVLWQWNTEEDMYCGYICREADWPKVQALCKSIGIEAAKGDEEFEDCDFD
jgi:hypothetical protein